MRFLQQTATSSHVAVVGKLRTYEAGARVNVAIDSESTATVDEETREAELVEAVDSGCLRQVTESAYERGCAHNLERAFAVLHSIRPS